LAAKKSNVTIITGDTKVVENGKGDGIYINTSGVGVIAPNLSIAATQIEAGDAIIINGDIGRHGMAIMAARQDLGFKGTIESDCASLSMMIQDVIDAKIAVHCMRDLTRGGLASALCELSGASKAQFEIKDNEIPINEKVAALGELLGIDPIHSACEGRLVMLLPQSEAEKALGVMRHHSVGADSRIIGKVENITDQGRVVLKTSYGTERSITMLSGEQLPRIC
jgi:hydrogenase expression/formation protein HypE